MSLPPIENHGRDEKEWQRQHAIKKAWEEEVTRLRARVEELEQDKADLNNSINVWMAHANEAEDRAAAAEAKLSVPAFPADMHGKPVTAPVSEFNYDMNAAPVGGKLIVLNEGNCATFAVLSTDTKKYFKAWSPMPKIRKDKR